MVDDDRSELSIPTPREGPSPFLEGTCIQFAFDSTCLGAFKKCPRFYQLSIIEGWKPKADRVHLSFGIHYTNALEFYDQLKAADLEFDHDAAVLAVVNKIMQDTWVIPPVDDTGDYIEQPYRWEHGAHDSGVGNKNFSNLLRSIIWYLDQFQHDACETVIAEDGTPLVERSFRMELDYGPQYLTADLLEPIKMSEYGTKEGKKVGEIPIQPYLLCGHLDRVVTFTGGTYVMDHKTTKTTISDYYFDQYEPNNQMSLYTLAGQVIFGSPVRGVMIDACQVAVGFSRFARGLTYRTPAQLEEWLFDLKHWLAQAEAYATAGYWPMNDVACFNCDFNKHDGKICAKDPRVRKDFLRASFTQDEPWNPLKVRN